ncbi:pyridoxamine 5'-phosphate oxidase family protein [Aurantivibrio plasticivorans]
MAEQFQTLTDTHIDFIKDQHIFFVGTAGSEGRVNVSPKGMDSFRVLNESKVAWLNLTGSGNESAAHVLENGRMTIMFCSFDKQPLIMRLYGQARVIHPRDADWDTMVQLFPTYTGSRQVFELDISLVQTSCGFAVPFYELVGERDTLNKWADKNGREGVEDYWRKNNTQSMDGKDTGIFEST